MQPLWAWVWACAWGAWAAGAADATYYVRDEAPDLINGTILTTTDKATTSFTTDATTSATFSPITSTTTTDSDTSTPETTTSSVTTTTMNNDASTPETSTTSPVMTTTMYSDTSTPETSTNSSITTSTMYREISTPETSTTSAVITTTTTTPTGDDLPTPPTPPTTRSALPVDCADHLMAGSTTSGVYDIYPFTCTCGRSVQVWCDMETDGGGWTVFLNRQNQTEQLDFNRTWDEYKEGFGSPHEEHWMGLETLHVMTFGRTYSVRLDLEEASGMRGYATHDVMRVEGEDTGYKIITTGTETGSSNSRYCLRYMNYRSFTTIDRDSDSLYTGNCAAMQGGGWWYYNCKYFNPTSTYEPFIALNCSGSTERNVTRLQVKIRPAICDTSLKTIHAREMSCGC